MAAAWVAMEVVRSSWPFSGMPWGRLAFATVDTPVAAALAYVGSVGVSFLLALLGCLLAALVPGPGEAGGGGRAPGGRGPHAWCPRWRRTTRAPDAHVTVAAVQGDVPGNGDDILLDFRQVTRNHVDATVDLARDVAAGRVPAPDFVIWPENSTAVDPFADAETGAAIEEASAAIGVPMLVGAIVDAGPRNVLNQGIVWDPETGAGDRYTKWHPVPYGEYIPFRRFFSGNFGRLALIPRDMLSGTRTDPLTIAGVRVGDAICFDVAYDDGLYAQVENGAQMLAVQTSNATFIHTSQIDQQFAISRLRAIETGRYVVVAATNGVSGVIAPGRDGPGPGRDPHPGRPRRADRARQRDHAGGPAGRLDRLALRGCRRRGAAAGAARVSSDVATERPKAAAVSIDGLGRVVVVIPTYNEAANLAWIVGRLRARAARRRRARRRRPLAGRHRPDRRPARRCRPPGRGAAPRRQGRPRRRPTCTASRTRSPRGTT